MEYTHQVVFHSYVAMNSGMVLISQYHYLRYYLQHHQEYPLPLNSDAKLPDAIGWSHLPEQQEKAHLNIIWYLIYKQPGLCKLL